MQRLLERLPPHIETVMVIDPDIRIRGTRRRQHASISSAPSAISSTRGRRGVPAHHDRAGRLPRALPGVRICAGVSRRAREPRGLQHHLRRLLLSPRCARERARGALALRVRGGSRERGDPADPRRAHLLRRAPGRQHRRARARCARWFSQRVGWYHGLLKVYVERFGEIWRISKRTPFAIYHFIIYLGGAVARPAPREDGQRGAAGDQLRQRLRRAVPGARAAAQARSPIRPTSSPRSAATWRSGVSRCSPSCRKPSAPTSRRSCRCICSTPSRTSCR